MKNQVFVTAFIVIGGMYLKEVEKWPKMINFYQKLHDFVIRGPKKKNPLNVSRIRAISIMDVFEGRIYEDSTRNRASNNVNFWSHMV